MQGTIDSFIALDAMVHTTYRAHVVLQRHQIDPSFFATEWFLTLYSYILEGEMLNRAFDLILVRGRIALFR